MTIQNRRADCCGNTGARHDWQHESGRAGSNTDADPRGYGNIDCRERRDAEAKSRDWRKFEGYGDAREFNTQITVRAKNNDMADSSFPLDRTRPPPKCRQLIDKGGFQYGDKITIFYDPNRCKR